jgi:hypothetical protein
VDEPGREGDLPTAQPPESPEPGSQPGARSDTPPWPEWGLPADRGRHLPRIGLIGVALLAGGLVIVAAFAWLTLFVSAEQGQVLFTTTDPGSGTGCIVFDRVTTIRAGTHAWMVVVFKRPMDDKPLTVQVSRNAVAVWSYTWPVSESKGRGCTYSWDLADFPAGAWTFTFTHDGQLEASGTLIIT